MKRHGRAGRPCRPGRLHCGLSPVSSRAADRTAVGVAVDASPCLNSLNLIIEPPERGFVPDVQLCCVLLGMDLVVIARISGVIIVDEIIIHNWTFLLTFVKPAC